MSPLTLANLGGAALAFGDVTFLAAQGEADDFAFAEPPYLSPLAAGPAPCLFRTEPPGQTPSSRQRRSVEGRFPVVRGLLGRHVRRVVWYRWVSGTWGGEELRLC